MMMMKEALVFVLLLGSSLLQTAEADTAWTVSTGSTSCSGDFTVSNVALTCDGSSQCSLGSTAKVTGYLMALRALPQPAHVVAQACFYSVCKTILETSNIDVCDGDMLVAQSGQTCPAAGLYKIAATFDLPSTSYTNMFAGYTLKVQATITEESSSSSSSSSDSSSTTTTTCTIKAKAVTQSYQLSWASVAAASLVFMLVGAYGIRRRTRCMARIDLDAAEEQLPSSDFEMMKQPMPHVSMA